MRQTKAHTIVRLTPLIGLLMLGGLLSSVQPAIASSFRPKNGSRPASESSGGRRAMSLCPMSPNQSSLLTAASMPQSEPQSEAGTVTVASVTPRSLRVQVPASPAQSALLKLEDGQGNYLYHTQFPLDSRAPTTLVTVPTTAPTLTPGESYRWSLALICNHTLDPNDPVFEGWIEGQ